MFKPASYPVLVEHREGGWLIMRGGPHQTGEKDAQWLTPEFTWSRNVFMAAHFEPHQRTLVNQCLEEVRNQDLPVLTDEEEFEIA